MRFFPVLKTVAVASAVLMLVAACGEGSNGSDSDDDANGYDGEGLPASDMTSWDVDCDWFFLDDLQDFLGYEEWTVGPRASDFGYGTTPGGLTCDGSYTWPEFETPHGRSRSVDATYTVTVTPADDAAAAATHYEGRIEDVVGDYVDDEVIEEGELEGPWDQSLQGVYDLDTSTLYYAIIQDGDFNLQLQTYVTNDPTAMYDKSELVPGEWAGYEFTQEEAIEFFFEQQLPNTHDQFLTLLERNG